MRMLTTVLAAILLLSVFSSGAVATGIIRVNWIDEYSGACLELLAAANDCTLCHTAGGSPTDLNPYAEDMQFYAEDQGVAYVFAIPGVAGDDSDGDGVDNGTEIIPDCTLPGDPLSVPTWERDWSQIKALFQ